MSLRKLRPLIEGRSGSFTMLSINEALFAVILVGRVISGNKSKKSLIPL